MAVVNGKRQSIKLRNGRNDRYEMNHILTTSALENCVVWNLTEEGQG